MAYILVASSDHGSSSLALVRGDLGQRETELREPIFCWADGSDTIVELLDIRVRIKRKRSMDALQSEREILICEISSVLFKGATMWTPGYIKFVCIEAARGDERSSQAASDRNAVLFTAKQQPEFEKFKLAIDERIREAQSLVGDPTYIPSQRQHHNY